MRSFQVFAAMSADESEAFFGGIKDSAPTIFQQSIYAAAASLKMRPAFVKKQPFAKQVSYARRALSRVAANPIADETLAMYFLEVKKDLLIEWLDQVGIGHDDGALTEDSPEEPSSEKVTEAVEKFRGGGGGDAKDEGADAKDGGDRELLLRAFAAQSAIDWATLDTLIAEKLPASK